MQFRKILKFTTDLRARRKISWVIQNLKMLSNLAMYVGYLLIFRTSRLFGGHFVYSTFFYHLQSRASGLLCQTLMVGLSASH